MGGNIAKRKAIIHLVLVGDSMIIVHHMNVGYPQKNPILRRMIKKFHELLQKYELVLNFIMFFEHPINALTV